MLRRVSFPDGREAGARVEAVFRLAHTQSGSRAACCGAGIPSRRGFPRLSSCGGGRGHALQHRHTQQLRAVALDQKPVGVRLDLVDPQHVLHIRDAQDGVADVDQQLGVPVLRGVSPLVGAGQGEPPLVIAGGQQGGRGAVLNVNVVKRQYSSTGRTSRGE